MGCVGSAFGVLLGREERVSRWVSWSGGLEREELCVWVVGGRWNRVGL